MVNFGVRFAQFNTKSNIALKSDPDCHPLYKYFGHTEVSLARRHLHSNARNLTATRSFHGLGPSLSWNASAPVAGLCAQRRNCTRLGPQRRIPVRPSKSRSFTIRATAISSVPHIGASAIVTSDNSINLHHSARRENDRLPCPMSAALQGFHSATPTPRSASAIAAISSSARWTAASTRRRKKMSVSMVRSPASASGWGDRKYFRASTSIFLLHRRRLHRRHSCFLLIPGSMRRRHT